uniref:Protein PRY1-like n=1 Tax=Saccoglossus kowalevskii TaxID=10224 RepID=A0ABM0MWS6_SACKO|nr:PREDICTED: protein PRY1-like [Saccoglossus kowalevskii]
MALPKEVNLAGAVILETRKRKLPITKSDDAVRTNKVSKMLSPPQTECPTCSGGAGGRSSGCSSGSLVEGQCSNPTGNAECNIGLDDIRQQMLDPHNFYRCKHGSPQLQLSSQLNDYAQEWAEELAATDSSEHSTNRGSNPPNRGENIWTGYDVFRWQSYDQFTGSTPVSDWYSEIVNYDFASGTLNSSNEHFTQLVWKSSDQLGCGIATAQRAYGPKFYVVCQYEPAGNFGNFDLNVPPLV